MEAVDVVGEVDIPASALIYAWIPFAVVVVAIFGFATFYVSLYKHKKVKSARQSSDALGSLKMIERSQEQTVKRSVVMTEIHL